VGLKNAGKTTLVCKLVELLDGLGYQVGTIKHDAHRFQMDHEGKDTWRHREAGARMVAISSELEGQTCYIEQRYTSLADMLARMNGMDFVIVEGFKSEEYPKLAVIRHPEQLELLGRVSPLLAVASWLPEAEVRHAVPAGIPVCHIDDAEGMLRLVLA
jgi:molybdopterin-guanine dinucleotide biosynthesis protein B